MCILIGNSRTSRTVQLIGRTREGEGFIHYRMGVVSNRAPQRSIERAAGRVRTFTNMMAWPVPARDHLSVRAIETSSAPQALSDVADTVESFAPKRAVTSFGFSSGGVALFENEHYTALVAERASQIPQALQDAGISIVGDAATTYQRLLGQFEDLYPGMPIPLILFNDDQPVQGSVLLAYDIAPEFQDILFSPCLDGHGAIELDVPVARDHVIALGVWDEQCGWPVVYSDRSSISTEMLKYLPPRVIGVKINEATPNCDMIFSWEDARRGVVNGSLVVPPDLLSPLPEWMLTDDGLF